MRISAAESRTDGTDWSRCSVVLARGMRCGLDETGGEGGAIGSMSRSKMAEDEECTEVGEDGIDPGEREPRRASDVLCI